MANEKRRVNVVFTSFNSQLKDKSEADKIIVKKQPYQLLNTNHELFQVLMPPTFINWLMNLRMLGQTSSPFGILYECAKARQGGWQCEW